MSSELITLSRPTLPEESPYIPPLMVAYVKFCWKYGDGDVERLWKMLSPYFGSHRKKAFDYAVNPLRKVLPTRRTKEETLKAKAEARRRKPRALARLFARDPENISAADREYLGELWGFNSELERAYELAQGFSRMLRRRDPEMLDGWLEEATRPSYVALPKVCAATRVPFGQPSVSVGATGR